LVVLLSSLLPAAAQNQRFVWRPNYTAQRQYIPPRAPTHEQYWQERGGFGAGNRYYGKQNRYEIPPAGFNLPAAEYSANRQTQPNYQRANDRGQNVNGLWPVHQFVHPYHGDQMLSLRPELEPALSEYISEGVQFSVSPTGGAGMIPLYRFVDHQGMHSFSTSRLPPAGGRLEQIMGFIYGQQLPDTVPLYGWFDAFNRHRVSTFEDAYGGHDLRRVGVIGYVAPY
jgi:hypothetical protein